jgi:hypothetical protein
LQRIGNDQAGFSVDYTPVNGLCVAGWGFWSVDVALAFATTVLEACGQAPRGAALTLDLRELKPMREEGQQSFSSLLRGAPILGITSLSIVTANPLTKLQLVRLVADSGSASSVQWLNGSVGVSRDA